MPPAMTADAGNNDHATTHTPTVADTPVGALPPISGGAPESSVPEADIAAESGSSAAGDVDTSAVGTDEPLPDASRAGGRIDRRASAESNHDLSRARGRGNCRRATARRRTNRQRPP